MKKTETNSVGPLAVLVGLMLGVMTVVLAALRLSSPSSGSQKVTRLEQYVMPAHSSQEQLASSSVALRSAKETNEQKMFETDHRTGAVPKEVIDPEGARIKALIEEAIVDLTPEERDLLNKHPPDTLSQAISDAEKAYRGSDDSNREELEEQYFGLLNLAGNLAPRPPPMPPDEVERYRRYAQVREARRGEFTRLSEKETASLNETIKDEIFRNAQGAPSSEPPMH